MYQNKANHIFQCKYLKADFNKSLISTCRKTTVLKNLCYETLNIMCIIICQYSYPTTVLDFTELNQVRQNTPRKRIASLDLMQKNYFLYTLVVKYFQQKFQSFYMTSVPEFLPQRSYTHFFLYPDKIVNFINTLNQRTWNVLNKLNFPSFQCTSHTFYCHLLSPTPFFPLSRKKSCFATLLFSSECMEETPVLSASMRVFPHFFPILAFPPIQQIQEDFLPDSHILLSEGKVEANNAFTIHEILNYQIMYRFFFFNVIVDCYSVWTRKGFFVCLWYGRYTDAQIY